VLSETPYVVRFPDLFSAGECRFLIELAEPRFRRATIFHERKQQFVEDPIRDSDAAGFTSLLEAPAIHALNRRIAAASGTSVSQGEPLQLLRYGVGQQYRRHLDAIPGLGNQRQLTMIVYLNDDYQGGETLFTATGLAVRGRLGEGLLFRNALPDGRPEDASQHAGCPVTHGTKLIASRWIRQRPPEHADQGFGPHEAVRRD
jgi:prolyl 4-hydroxylase